jgi:RIO kinase 1
MAFRAQLWLLTEFDVLCRLWSVGAPVPYPVQKLNSEIMVELIGSPEEAAPRLVHAGLSRAQAAKAWTQLVEAMHLMARNGVVHGDLSPYNILWHEDRIVIIDFPQAVDPIAHAEGMSLLERDCTNVCDWFTRRGVETPSPGELFSEVLASAF